VRKFFIAFLVVILALVGILFYFNIKIFCKIRQKDIKVNSAEKILYETQEAKTVVEQNIVSKDVKIDGFREEIEKEKDKSIELSRKLSEKVNEVLIIKNELRKVNKELEKFKETEKTETKEQEKFKQENEQLKQENKELLERLEKLKNYVPSGEEQINEQGERIIFSEAGIENNVKLEGKILMINNKFKFVMVNLGAVDNIQTEQMLNVVRDGVVVAKLRVEKIYEKMCSAFLIQDSLKVDKLKKGDMVKNS
jgi:chromosome segregation ATPase